MIDIAKYRKRLDVSYARYLKFKRADRYAAPDDVSFAERHTVRVSFLKKFILRLVILLILLLVIWPLANKDWGGQKLNFSSREDNGSEKQSENKIEKLPAMMKPNFYGNDNNGQPFNINADSGISVSEDKIVLNNIVADMSLRDNSRINLSSRQGDFSNKQKELILNGGVKINTDKSYEFNTNSAYVKLSENMATGSDNVAITGRLGNINSKGFIIRNSGDEIVLFGNVNLIANLDEGEVEKITEGDK